MTEYKSIRTNLFAYHFLPAKQLAQFITRIPNAVIESNTPRPSVHGILVTYSSRFFVNDFAGCDNNSASQKSEKLNVPQSQVGGWQSNHQNTAKNCGHPFWLLGAGLLAHSP
jgi:hypothetical protein